MGTNQTRRKGLKIKTAQTVIAIVLLALGAEAQQPANSRMGVQAKSTTNRVKFQPEGCEFYVLFPDKPSMSNMDMKGETGERIKVTRAEMVLPNAFVRAEFTRRPWSPLELLDEALINAAHKYAEHTGLEYPEVSVRSSKLGKYVTLRGYKSIEGIKCTYEAITYYGEEGILLLYAGGPSKGYPQPGIPEFLHSVSK